MVLLSSLSPIRELGETLLLDGKIPLYGGWYLIWGRRVPQMACTYSDYSLFYLPCYYEGLLDRFPMDLNGYF